VEGRPFVQIIRAAREGASELVVVGRHGQRRFRDLLLGSTAERVIRKGRTSVLIVTAPATTAYRQPLVAVDFSDRSRHALELAWRLADGAPGALGVVHAYEALSQRAIERAGFSFEDGVHYQLQARRHVDDVIRRFLAGSQAGAAAAPIAREGDPRGVILDVTAEHHADLLAIGTHGHSAAVHVLIGSVAEAVIRQAGCDVLVASAPERPFELP
jgi:nucleotide-binding universal stress UspA family protein